MGTERGEKGNSKTRSIEISNAVTLTVTRLMAQKML